MLADMTIRPYKDRRGKLKKGFETHFDKPKKELSKVLKHLQSQLEVAQAMTSEERAEVLKEYWIPSIELLTELLKPHLLQRDRVELIFIHYKRDTKGESPTWDIVGNVLGCAAKNAMLYGHQLLDPDPRFPDYPPRAEMTQEKFRLVQGGYQHPLLSRKS